jgi:short chain dehydrogenase
MSADWDTYGLSAGAAVRTQAGLPCRNADGACRGRVRPEADDLELKGGTALRQQDEQDVYISERRCAPSLRAHPSARLFATMPPWPSSATLSCCAVNDKQILITGATNGIGLAAAEALVALGANLAIVGRSKSRTRVAAARISAAQERSDGGHIPL